ncbi:PREDICTED: uncharacterized protein LOC106102650 [Papilio polytes]|uniref:uncharacterized protein LOC106102650 n=1 Tax=Papilio polytes TaxID=76194 RepID=UPI00067629A6|nr:PREDICTED: uncharacterized protein LOC106102650 [Papilio polytes]
MEYTPHQGVSLETQLAMGAWLCQHVGGGGGASEWAWSVLERLRVHRSQWAVPLDASPPHAEPQDVFSTAFALLATSWGHSVPLICSVGVRALVGVARARAGAAARCLVAMMRAVQHTPESVALTPEFTEVFNILLGSGPSLMARALGRAGPSSAELLEKALLNELLTQSNNAGILNPWLRGLWAPGLPAAARALLDTALRAAEDVPALDTVVSLMLQNENHREFLDDAVRNASVAPVVCEAALRGAHAQCELPALMWPRLMDALAQQRARGQKVHVDNALKQIGCTISSEELVLYRVASAVLGAPLAANLALWRLLLHLYLQRPPSNPQLTSMPVGPLFFSGIIKSRVLSQLKKRLKETIDYHKKQSDQLKSQVYPQTEQIPTTSESRKQNNIKTERKLFTPITINDLIGECRSDSESESSEEEITEERVSESSASREKFHLFCYHSGAVKMLCEYNSWLTEGDKVRAAPHHADIARFIQQEGIIAARRNSLPGWFLSAPPPRPRAPPPAPPSPLQQAIHALLQIKETRPIAHIPNIKPLLDEESNLSDARVIFNLVDRHLKTMESDAQVWVREVSQLSQLDSQLLELVRALRVRRPLPVYTRWCGNDTCKPIKIAIQGYEWVISRGAEEGIEQNRRCALAAVRVLARPRPATARVAATLQSLARVVRSRETAVRVAERAGRSAAAAHRFPPAMDAITSLVTYLAECWVCEDAEACGRLVRAWAGGVARLIGVHIVCVCGASETCALVVGGARACARGSLPPSLCTHITHAAAHAHALTYNQVRCYT